MQQEAKILMAVIHILLCIQYVQVPEIINNTGWNHGFIRMLKTQDEKLAIFLRNTEGEIKRPSMTSFRIYCLYEDRFQVQIGQNTLFFHFHHNRLMYS